MNEQVPKSFRPGLNNPFYFIRHALLEKITHYAPMLSGKLLDFGCGSKPYKSLFTHATEYIGLDYEGEGHSHRDEQVDVFYDGRHIPFPDASFDAVFSSEVMEHIFNPEIILPEINRVMKKGARILITCPFAWPEHEVPVDYARYTRFALQHLLEKNGFTILEIDKSGDFSMAIYQMKMVFFSEHVIPAVPLFGKSKFFRVSIAPALYVLMNSWYIFKHWLLPKRKDWYLNNIVLAEKK